MYTAARCGGFTRSGIWLPFRSMRKNPFHPGPYDKLSDDAIAALRRIKQGQAISSRQYLDLEINDLIQQGLSGWRLTEVGQYRLERGH